MKLYYSTYGMQQEDVFSALPRLRDMGYEGMEIAVTPGWTTDPMRFAGDQRSRLAALLIELGFPTPPLMALLSPCVTGEDRPAMLEQFAATFDMAHHLRVSDEPAVVTTTLGHPKPAWDDEREAIIPLVSEVADMAAQRDVVLAIEPHAGGDFETPEKAVWLMEQSNHPHLKLNFDYSHFWVEGMDLAHCIALNVPYAAHNHIKDGYIDDEGNVRYLLPGDGTLDMSEYMRAVRAAGWNRYVCPEITAQIWKQPEYDAWATAQRCYDALDAARRTL